MTRRKDRFSWGCSPMSCPGGHWDYGVRGRGRGTEPALEGGVCSRAGCGHLVPTVRGRVQGRHPLGGVPPPLLWPDMGLCPGHLLLPPSHMLPREGMGQRTRVFWKGRRALSSLQVLGWKGMCGPSFAGALGSLRHSTGDPVTLMSR